MPNLFSQLHLNSETCDITGSVIWWNIRGTVQYLIFKVDLLFFFYLNLWEFAVILQLDLYVPKWMIVGCQVYSSMDLSRGHLEEKGEAEEKKSESPLTVDTLSWTPDFTEMYEYLHL